MPKKKILIDLDVVTVAIWDKKDKRRALSQEFLKRIENKEFYVITAYSILNIVDTWENKPLANDIKDFYSKNSDYFIGEAELFEELKNVNVNVGVLLSDLMSHNIKDEDSILVLCCSVKDAKLITFNRRHLKNKQSEIKEVLKKYGLQIDILFPNEI